MKYTFHIVDVFSSTPFGGNQLAILPDAAGISAEGMQKIAREFNLGETYCIPHQLRSREIGKLRSCDRKGAVTKPTAPRFTGLVTRIDLDAADGAAARPSGYRDGRR